MVAKKSMLDSHFRSFKGEENLMDTQEKARAMQRAFDAISEANKWELSEEEKSFLCDCVFETAPRDTKRDGTVSEEHQYPKPKTLFVM